MVKHRRDSPDRLIESVDDHSARSDQSVAHTKSDIQTRKTFPNATRAGECDTFAPIGFPGVALPARIAFTICHYSQTPGMPESPVSANNLSEPWCVRDVAHLAPPAAYA